MKKSLSIIIISAALLLPSLANACGCRADLEAADTNRDKALNNSEFMTLAKTQFSRMDENHDGKIVMQEYKSFKKQCKGAHKGKETIKHGDD